MNMGYKCSMAMDKKKAPTTALNLKQKSKKALKMMMLFSNLNHLIKQHTKHLAHTKHRHTWQKENFTKKTHPNNKIHLSDLLSNNNKGYKCSMESMEHYYPHNHYNTKPDQKSTKMHTHTMALTMNKRRSILWLGKMHDTNTLFPWSSNQPTHPHTHNTTHMNTTHSKKMGGEKFFSFHTNTSKHSSWKMKMQNSTCPAGAHFSMDTHTLLSAMKNHNMKKQDKMNTMSNNKKMKINTNKLTGQLWTKPTQNMQSKTQKTHTPQINTASKIMNLSLMKQQLFTCYNQTYHMNTDAITQRKKSSKNSSKEKMGYTKSEKMSEDTKLETTWNCNTMISQTLMNHTHNMPHECLFMNNDSMKKKKAHNKHSKKEYSAMNAE